MSKLKVIEKILVEEQGKTLGRRYYKLNDKTFMITYENSNGIPLGFNSKMCLKQYDKDNGKWNNLEDIRVLNMEKAPNVYDARSSKAHMEEFFKKMEKHLELIYS